MAYNYTEGLWRVKHSIMRLHHLYGTTYSSQAYHDTEASISKTDALVNDVARITVLNCCISSYTLTSNMK